MLLCSHAEAQLYIGSCYTDEEIASDLRQQIDTPATQFAKALLSGNPAGAYPLTTPDIRQTQTQEAFVARVKGALPSGATFTTISIHHTYLEVMSTVGKPNGPVPCTTEAHGDISKQGGRTDIDVLPLEQQAYVIAEAETANTTWAIVLWLVPEHLGKVWRVGSFVVQPMSLLGKTAILSGPSVMQRSRMKKPDVAE